MSDTIKQTLQKSWKIIAPFWPLENLIAVNPLQGFTDTSFHEAVTQKTGYFEQTALSEKFKDINRITIKWMQVITDQGQATFAMPLSASDKYSSWKKLIIYDKELHGQNNELVQWIKNIPDAPYDTLSYCFDYLKLLPHEYTDFTDILLTTLYGWTSYIQYCNTYSNKENSLTCEEYTALRAIITCLLYPQARELLHKHDAVQQKDQSGNSYVATIQKYEKSYKEKLLSTLKNTAQHHKKEEINAQFVFCIDVRSEPFRRALELNSAYETYGYAGFFGLPINICDVNENKTYQACPVILAPSQSIHYEKNDSSYACVSSIKRLYQSLKYNLVTVFPLVEALGLPTAVWMTCKTWISTWAKHVKNNYSANNKGFFILDDIPLSLQVEWAFNFITSLSIKEFSSVIMLVGHASSTENNAFASALDCGACAGRAGGNNARIMVHILNSQAVRDALKKKQIFIPDSTQFFAAQHNTTTDECHLYDDVEATRSHTLLVENIKKDFSHVCKKVNYERALKMGYNGSMQNVISFIQHRSSDWAQVRPEWGLAGNASFIIAPRSVTASCNFEGRAFLHSYDWQRDPNGAILHSIIAGPLMVGYWINAQYLFSTLNPVAYGAGSKITKNITGKMGVMQGNASDLMTGLPIQSVYKNDTTYYHEPVRLTAVIYAPCDLIVTCISQQPDIYNLVKNEWIFVIAYDPPSYKLYHLQPDLSWKEEIC